MSRVEEREPGYAFPVLLSVTATGGGGTGVAINTTGSPFDIDDRDNDNLTDGEEGQLGTDPLECHQTGAALWLRTACSQRADADVAHTPYPAGLKYMMREL